MLGHLDQIIFPLKIAKLEVELRYSDLLHNASTLPPSPAGPSLWVFITEQNSLVPEKPCVYPCTFEEIEQGHYANNNVFEL